MRSASASPGRDERWGVWGAISWPPMSLEGRHDLRREALELLQNHRLGRADRLADVDDLQTRVAAQLGLPSGTGARAGADYRLPALDGQRLRAWHQRDLLELVAPVGHLGREGVVLALMRKGALVERFENDLDLLLEQLPVGVLIEQRRAEGLDLARVVAAPDAEDDPAPGQPVDGGVVLGHPQRVPHRRDVEAATDLDVLRDVPEVQGQQQDVRDALVPFALEVMLGQPEGVVAPPIH